MKMVVEVAAAVSSLWNASSNPKQRMQTPKQRMTKEKQLLKLAAWYRELADRTGSPMIWECRLQMAEDLESEACRLARRERGLSPRDMRGST